MLYDIGIITWLRREHHILGVLMGTLPQAPSQNVFLGLPLELMPEEARLLVEKGLAYIVRDSQWHSASMRCTDASMVQVYKEDLQKKGRDALLTTQAQKEQRAQAATKKLQVGESVKDNVLDAGSRLEEPIASEEPQSVFEARESRPFELDSKQPKSTEQEWVVTPATTYPPLPPPPASEKIDLPTVKESQYALFKHLHDRGYYMSPGLRFGCQYMAYPGDPLRFHSHFLAVSADLDDELDLLDIVGGGRLGTGVKKGFVLGGIDTRSGHIQADYSSSKVFSLEWAGM